MHVPQRSRRGNGTGSSYDPKTKATTWTYKYSDNGKDVACSSVVDQNTGKSSTTCDNGFKSSYD
ncbi:MAG TPA: hypothetical protein VFP65_26375, partial [Anaeromyxobacteraceae bacterium]|nr:hypothetical protein [Anaeromyxobacteraceae bacterium]